MAFVFIFIYLFIYLTSGTKSGLMYFIDFLSRHFEYMWLVGTMV